MEYPKDRLYLRVGLLIKELKEYSHRNSNIQLLSYLIMIEKGVTPHDTNWVIKTENHLLSENFTSQECFKEIDKINIKSIIRN